MIYSVEFKRASSDEGCAQFEFNNKYTENNFEQKILFYCMYSEAEYFFECLDILKLNF